MPAGGAKTKSGVGGGSGGANGGAGKGGLNLDPIEAPGTNINTGKTFNSTFTFSEWKNYGQHRVYVREKSAGTQYGYIDMQTGKTVIGQRVGGSLGRAAAATALGKFATKNKLKFKG